MPEDITPSRTAGRTGLLQLSPQVQIELDLCGAIDKLTISLQSLRMAMETADNAPGQLGLPDDCGRQTEASQLRARWYAASQILNASSASVEADGTAVINMVKTMLALE